MENAESSLTLWKFQESRGVKKRCRVGGLTVKKEKKMWCGFFFVKKPVYKTPKKNFFCEVLGWGFGRGNIPYYITRIRNTIVIRKERPLLGGGKNSGSSIVPRGKRKAKTKSNRSPLFEDTTGGKRTSMVRLNHGTLEIS